MSLFSIPVSTIEPMGGLFGFLPDFGKNATERILAGNKISCGRGRKACPAGSSRESGCQSRRPRANWSLRRPDAIHRGPAPIAGVLGDGRVCGLLLRAGVLGRWGRPAVALWQPRHPESRCPSLAQAAGNPREKLALVGHGDAGGSVGSRGKGPRARGQGKGRRGPCRCRLRSGRGGGRSHQGQAVFGLGAGLEA